MTFNTFFLIRLLLLHCDTSSYQPATVYIYLTYVQAFICIRFLSSQDKAKLSIINVGTCVGACVCTYVGVFMSLQM